MSDAGAWDWLALVDPERVERERFRANPRTLRNREGTHRGILPEPIRPDARIIRALTKEREREDREHHRAIVRGQLAGRIRRLEATLERERTEHARSRAWHQKVSAWGHRTGGPSSLGTA